MTGMSEVKRRKYFEGMKIPHTYVIISCIVLLAFIATYLVPAGRRRGAWGRRGPPAPRRSARFSAPLG